MTNSESGAEHSAAEYRVTEYDELPYPSLPVSYCHPSSLAALVRLFALKPPVTATARILEMGCASGGNLIPLAVQYPNASFVGVDLSDVQVRAANTRISELGLRNISVTQGDLLKASFSPDAFDYILCHGVFSWVGRPVQDAILRICSNSLSADGIAVISFNVLPGWHLRRVVRDICLLHAGKGSQSERVGRARRALVEIANNLSGSDVYTTLLQAEARRLQKMPSAYISGEFLAEHNLPCLFSEFYSRSKQVGLEYVCDAEFSTSLPQQMAPASAQLIGAMSGGNAGAAQQYIDLFTGRPFRRAILVHGGRVSGDMNAVDPSGLQEMHFAAELTPNRRAAGSSQMQPDNISEQLLHRLAAESPSTMTFHDLSGFASRHNTSADTVRDSILELMNRGQVAAFADPLHVGRGDTSHPTAWPVARLDAKAPQPWLTSQHHRAIRKIPALALLLPLMDGSRTRTELQSELEVAVQQGKLDLPRPANGTAPQPASTPNIFAAAMEYAARNGLLCN
ncbi:MAG: class I SAM-dependent methyltransferase [Micropepsaceae bacterium]